MAYMNNKCININYQKGIKYDPIGYLYCPAYSPVVSLLGVNSYQCVMIHLKMPCG